MDLCSLTMLTMILYQRLRTNFLSFSNEDLGTPRKQNVICSDMSVKDGSPKVYFSRGKHFLIL